jgi:hypothetical protein
MLMITEQLNTIIEDITKRMIIKRKLNYFIVSIPFFAISIIVATSCNETEKFYNFFLTDEINFNQVNEITTYTNATNNANYKITCIDENYNDFLIKKSEQIKIVNIDDSSDVSTLFEIKKNTNFDY